MYKTIEEIPDEYRYIFEKLIQNGIIQRTQKGDINITKELFEMILILGRLGLLP